MPLQRPAPKGVFYLFKMAGQIHRQKKNRDFVTIDTHCLRNPNLKWDAKGLHSYLMQLPDDWSVNIYDLQKRSKTGRDGTQSAMDALIKEGYVYRELKHGEGGKFDGYDYHLFERPEHTENWKTVNGKSVNGLAVNGKSVTTKYDSPTDLSKNVERGENEKNSPSPADNFSSLKAEKKEKAPPIAPVPPPETRITIHDPEAPGATIHDIVSQPHIESPANRINLGDRATAETPYELETSLREFYKDWPNEWAYGVLENSRGKKYSTERRTEIVRDFCCWAIENNRQRDTFRQLNARLQSWFRNEEHATWKQKAAPGQAPTQTPDQNFYRRNPIK